MVSKSGQGLVLAVVVIIIIIGAITWFASLAKHECEKDTECPSEYYCGVDHKCHAFPVIEKTVIEYNLVLPSIILGVSIIIAAILLRRRRKRPKTPTLSASSLSTSPEALPEAWTRPFAPPKR